MPLSPAPPLPRRRSRTGLTTDRRAAARPREGVGQSAKELAIATVRETGMGNVADKTRKNRFASLRIYASLAGKTAQGSLSFDADRQVTELASPSASCSRSHPSPIRWPPDVQDLDRRQIAQCADPELPSSGARGRTTDSWHRARHVAGARRAGRSRAVGPAAEPQNEPAVHGPSKGRDRPRDRQQGLVEAAYSSGTPAIGVGPGNAPAWICADADLDGAARRSSRARHSTTA